MATCQTAVLRGAVVSVAVRRANFPTPISTASAAKMPNRNATGAKTPRRLTARVAKRLRSIHSSSEEEPEQCVENVSLPLYSFKCFNRLTGVMRWGELKCPEFEWVDRWRLCR